MTAARNRFCLVRDMSFSGEAIYAVGRIGRCVDAGSEWDWPRYMVRYRTNGKFEREAYERAIKHGETFGTVEEAEAALARVGGAS